jgi:hypothetical protein
MTLCKSSPRSNRGEPICFSPYLYRARNLVERFALVGLVCPFFFLGVLLFQPLDQFDAAPP